MLSGQKNGLLLSPVLDEKNSSQSALSSVTATTSGYLYPVIDTGQTICNNEVRQITAPQSEEVFYDPDALYSGYHPEFTLRLVRIHSPILVTAP